MIALVAAVADNDVIGSRNALPWHLPEDLRRFRQLTIGKPVVMGRRTFDSIRRALPGRTNIIVTRNSAFHAPEVTVAGDIDSALDIAAKVAEHDGVSDIMVLGGEQIYRATLDRADRVYLTRVHACPEGDAYFPALDPACWRLGVAEDWPADAQHSAACTFCVYDRIGQV